MFSIIFYIAVIQMDLILQLPPSLTFQKKQLLELIK